MDQTRELLRHTLASLAYRATRAVENAPADFATFDACGREPGKILAHMGDLLDWALSLAKGHQQWHNSIPLPWKAEVERFYAALGALDDYLASPEPVHTSIERLFQGPVADALTHVGQLAMLRRIAGCPTRGENFFVAEIASGKVGVDQAPPVKTF
ncbi:MAG: hypothetical protein KGN79_10770 [Acidobacteriota bacterium]|nr:hypothetical protein [Acidobacteriota bacterium]